MSRIHEALKRAEQERTARDNREPSPQQSAPEMLLPVLSEPPHSGEEMPPPTSGESGAVASSLAANSQWPEPVGFETSLTRCKQFEWNPDESAMLFFTEGNHQYQTEVFRTLRSRLYRIRDQINLRTLLITSTLPAEGKSFIAANLGQAIARQHGHRALLIDADLRVPRLHTMFGAPQSPGLTEYLRGEVDEVTAIQRGPREGFFLLPCGSTVANPVELIGNGRLKKLLDRVRPAFDWIILDSPPMTPVSDSSLLADMCDGALLVVKASGTPFDLAQKACAEFKNAPLVGVVLNQIDQSTGYNGYYYSYYDAESGKA